MAKLRVAGVDLPVIRAVGLDFESAIELAKN
jgi:hypothetical protein